MRKPWVVSICTWLLLSVMAAFAQNPIHRVPLPACPECVNAGQSSGPNLAPQVTFVDTPKPPDLSRFVGSGSKARNAADLYFDLTARVVSLRPLMVDVLDVGGPMGSDEGRMCGFSPLPYVDAKLKTLLPSLKFGRVVKIRLLLSGTNINDWKMVVTSITFDAQPDDGHGACPSKSGIAVSIRGSVPYVNVYNDGTIDYMDYYFNRFRTEKLSQEEMAQLFKAFAESSFNSLPSTPPIPGKVDSHSVTLVCSRYQRVPDAGLESQLAPVMQQFELLKVRATANAYYLLMTSGRKKLTILDWPFTQVRLSDIANLRNRPNPQKPALEETVPADFMAKLPQQKVGTAPPAADEDPPDRYVYVRDEGRLYRVIRSACWGATPHCTKFQDLGAYLVEQVRPGDLTVQLPSDKVTTLPPREGVLFGGSPALEWPSYMGIDIAAVGKEGHRLTNQQFDSQPLYYHLFERGVGGMGSRFVEGDYIYNDVRVCRVDPGAPPSHCVSPVMIKGLYRPVW